METTLGLTGYDNVIIHCETQEEYNRICDLLGIIRNRNWEIYKERTCVGDYGKYSPIEYYKKNNYRIFNSTDFGNE